MAVFVSPITAALVHNMLVFVVLEMALYVKVDPEHRSGGNKALTKEGNAATEKVTGSELFPFALTLNEYVPGGIFWGRSNKVVSGKVPVLTPVLFQL